MSRTKELATSHTTLTIKGVLPGFRYCVLSSHGMVVVNAIQGSDGGDIVIPYVPRDTKKRKYVVRVRLAGFFPFERSCVVTRGKPAVLTVITTVDNAYALGQML